MQRAELMPKPTEVIPGESRARAQLRRPSEQTPPGKTNLHALAPIPGKSAGFPTKPLLLGIGIGAALALTAVALRSRSAKPSYSDAGAPSIGGALGKTALVLLARTLARKALTAAANHGARKLASALPL